MILIILSYIQHKYTVFLGSYCIVASGKTKLPLRKADGAENQRPPRYVDEDIPIKSSLVLAVGACKYLIKSPFN